MKNIIYITLILSLINCGNSAGNEKSKSSVLTAKEKYTENSKLTILNLVKNNPFNEAGYALLKSSVDEYGYTNWEIRNPTFVFDKSVYTELKKYKTAADFWYSSYGENIIDKMIDCYKNNSKICYIPIKNKTNSSKTYTGSSTNEVKVLEKTIDTKNIEKFEK